MVILVRFGELGLKSPYVRKQLLDRLVGNIQDLFAAEGIECLTRSDRGRVYVDANDLAAATGALRRVFGIVSFRPPPGAAGRLRGGGSFAIRARRSGTHTYSSQDLATLLGRRIQEAVPGARVDLSSPEVEVRVEVRENKAYVFDKVVDGPGGLPMGSQGRAGRPAGPRGGGGRAGGAGAEAPLRRWDTHLKVLSYEPGQDLADLVKASRSEAVFTGTRVDEIPDEKPALSVPVFHPVVGMDAGEVRALAERIRAA